MVKHVIDSIRRMTGIYDLGFKRESALGILLPFAFVVVVGGIGAALVMLLR